MNWYYAEGGQQQGPVTEADFQALAQNGIIGPTTLVWREGLPNWVPYQSLAQDTSSAVMPAPPVVSTLPPIGSGCQCAECQRFFPPEEVIAIGGQHVCAQCKPIFLQKMQEGVPTALTGLAGTMVYALFWKRAVAYFIDNLVLQAAGMLVAVPAGIMMGRMQTGGGANQAAIILLQVGLWIFGVLLGMAYNVYFLNRFAATPGKMVFKLQVVRADGSRLSLGRCYGRYFATMLSSMTCCIGFLLPLWDEQRRALHDHVCDTRVIQKPQ